MPRWVVAALAAVVTLGALSGPVCSEASEPAELGLRAGILVGTVNARDDEGPLAAGTGGGAPGGKSVVKGMLFSALLPGLGEIYADGTRGYVTGGLMAAADIFSSWQYFSNDGKGDDSKREYRQFAGEHYSSDRFRVYVADTVARWSGCDELKHCRDDLYQEEVCNQEIDDVFRLADQQDDDYYQQIASDERYVMGWDDWDPYALEKPEDRWTSWDCANASGIPDGLPSTTEHLEQYRSMRAEADDFYSKADRFAWVMVIGRVVSMIDTAILVKIRNSDLAGLGTNPRLSFKVDLKGKPDLRVGLKMRF